MNTSLRSVKLPEKFRLESRRNSTRKCIWDFNDRFSLDDPAQKIITETSPKETEANEPHTGKDILGKLKEYYKVRILQKPVIYSRKSVTDETNLKVTVLKKEPETKPSEEPSSNPSEVRLRSTQMRVVWKSERGTHADKEKRKREYEEMASEKQAEQDAELFAMISRARKSRA